MQCHDGVVSFLDRIASETFAELLDMLVGRLSATLAQLKPEQYYYCSFATAINLDSASCSDVVNV